VLHHHDHPDANAIVRAEERRAGDPSRSTGLFGGVGKRVVGVVGVRGLVWIFSVVMVRGGIVVNVRGSGARQPSDFGGDGDASGEGVAKAVADVLRAADVCGEGGLEQAGDAEGGRDEDDVERGRGADEEILRLNSSVMGALM